MIAAAALGLPIAAWRSYTAHRQAETAQNSLLDERYQRAAEMLGGGLAVRLAGIHALVRMAQSNLTHHVLIMSALSAVVRTSAKRQDVPGKGQTPEDVTVIMEALGARSPEQLLMETWENYRLDLRATDLRGLGVNEATLPRAILDDAILSDFDNRAVLWNTDLQNASLVSAGLIAASFYEAELAFADLSDANLTDATLDGTDLQEATLTGANFSNAKFEGTNIENAILDDANLTNVTGLTQQQLNSAKIDPSHPPILAGAIDPDTGKPLVVPS